MFCRLGEYFVRLGECFVRLGVSFVLGQCRHDCKGWMYITAKLKMQVVISVCFLFFIFCDFSLKTADIDCNFMRHFLTLCLYFNLFNNNRYKE